jgi:hypothetical protein
MKIVTISGLKLQNIFLVFKIEINDVNTCIAQFFLNFSINPDTFRKNPPQPPFKRGELQECHFPLSYVFSFNILILYGSNNIYKDTLQAPS